LVQLCATRSRIQPGSSAKNLTRSIKRPQRDPSRQWSTDTIMQIAFRPRTNCNDSGARFLRRFAARGSKRFCVRKWEGKGRSFVEQDKGPAVRCGVLGRFSNEPTAFLSENLVVSVQCTARQKRNAKRRSQRQKSEVFGERLSIRLFRDRPCEIGR